MLEYFSSVYSEPIDPPALHALGCNACWGIHRNPPRALFGSCAVCGPSQRLVGRVLAENPRGGTRTRRGGRKARGSEARAALVALAVREGAASTLEPLI